MQETVHTLSEDIKLSISDERQDRYKLIFNHGERFIYFDENVAGKVVDIIQSE